MSATGTKATSRPPAAVFAVVLAAAVLAVVVLLVLPGDAFAAAQAPDTTIRASFPSGPPAQPKINSTAAILIDADTGQILFSKDANERLPMASTTKIMTAILVLENLDPTTKVRVSAKAVSVIGSKASLVQGETLTVDDLLRAMLIISGNDAAVALAEATAGSVKDFVTMMNAKAKDLGLKNTHFTNPHGVNASGHYSSAKDLATLARYARTLPLFRQIVDTEGVCLPTLPGQKPRRWDHNSNSLLKKLDWVNGVKTGSTPDSAFCLVASGTQEGVNVIAVVLGAKTADARWTEAQELMEYGFALHPTTVLASKGEVVATVPLPDIMGRSMKLVADRPVTARLGKADVVTRSVVLDRDLALPVTAGEIYGRAIYSLNGAIIGSVELRAEQSVTRPTLDTILFYWRARSQVTIVRPA